MVSYIKNKFLSPSHAKHENITLFIGRPGFEKHFKPLKKMEVESAFGILELAIIGSSHYLKVPNQFTEVFSTTLQSFGNRETIRREKRSSYEIDVPINNINYKVSKRILKDFESKAVYKKTVDAHIEESNLHHKFGLVTTGVTTLRYTKTENEFELDTMHSYPKQGVLVYTTSTLSRNRFSNA